MAHDVRVEEYYLRYVNPMAVIICYCGKKMKFHGLKIGFLTYCSPSCAIKSDEVTRKRKAKWEDTYKKVSLSNVGRIIPQYQRDAVSAARKKMVGPLHHGWNPDRVEQARKKKLSKLVHGLVGRALAYTGQKKTGHGQELLGYSSGELRKHIESKFLPGMTWENHGKGEGKWNVDHVKPISDFGLDANISEINALSNLRPLWAFDNLSLGGKQACKVRWGRWKKSF